jgi:hypothetical protein
MARPRILIAARVLCYINGRLVGRVTGFSYAGLTPHKEARGVDDPTVQEFMPTTIGVNGTITLLRTLGDGGAQGAGLTVPQNIVSKQKYFTLVLVERETDQTIFKATECVANSESWNIMAKQIVAGTVNFSGRIYTNEAG